MPSCEATIHEAPSSRPLTKPGAMPMKRDCLQLKLLGPVLFTLLAQPVYAENAGAFAAVLDRIIPGVLWTVLGGYGLLVALVLT